MKFGYLSVNTANGIHPGQLGEELEEREFKVGMTSYAAEVLLPGLVERLAYSYPNISCAMQDLHAESLSSVKKGELDCCVTFQQTTILAPTESIDELSHSYLFSDDWVLIAAADNAEVVENIPYERFCDLPYVATRFGWNLSSYVERILDRQKMRPHPYISVTSFELAITSVLNSPCVTVVPALLVDERVRPLLKMFKPPFEMPKIEEILVWHSRNDADPGLAWFRELMVDVAHKLATPKYNGRNAKRLIRAREGKVRSSG